MTDVLIQSETPPPCSFAEVGSTPIEPISINPRPPASVRLGDSDAQRQSIDKESQALQAEYGRILDTTSFNGIRVFGSGDVVVQAGVGVDAVLLVKLSSGESVSMSNKGDGTFQARQAFGAGGDPVSVALVDFNNDGKSDIVTSSPDYHIASVLLSNGDGTFQAEQDFATGIDPGSVAVGDFNGDGKSDIVTADENDWTASVLLGNGNGTFQARRAFDVGNDPWLVAVGDFNVYGPAGEVKQRAHGILRWELQRGTTTANVYPASFLREEIPPSHGGIRTFSALIGDTAFQWMPGLSAAS